MLRVSLAMSLLVGLSSSIFGQNNPQNRIANNIDSSSLTRVPGNVHRLAHPEFDTGKVDGNLPIQRVTMAFKRSQSQQAELDALLNEQNDRASPNYHKWITPEQFGTRFGLSESDFNKIVTWLQAQGLQIVDAPASRTHISFSGTAAQVSSALHTEIHNYVVDGEKHYANAADPAVPAAFADVVLGFRSLNDFRPKPRRIVTRKVNPNFTSSVSGNHFLAPDDMATIYNVRGFYNAGYDGTGQKIAVVGQSDIIPADIAAFRSASGLPVNAPTVILVPGSANPGVVNGDIEETNLDLQWSGAIARNARIIYVYSKNGAFDALQYAVTHNLAPVISISYGNCEPLLSGTEIATLSALGQQANALGITITAAAGDSGAADCDFSSTGKITSATHGPAVDVPASLPYVTGVGGTTFNEGSGNYWNSSNSSSGGSALSYIPETSWNETANVGGLTATGGGRSKDFAKPVWQVGTGVPNDNIRGVPDISFAASANHDGYLVCSQGSCVNGFRDANNNLTVFGGTSAGAPVFAGIVALINQVTGSAQGNVNPTLYSLATSAPNAFHDITSGDNIVPCTAGSTGCPAAGTIGFPAGVGYDLVTGLGSPDAFVLASLWAGGTTANPDFQLAASTSTLTVGPASPATSTITAVPLNGFSGTIAWSCTVSSQLTSAAACAVTPDPATPNAKATLSVTALRQAARAQSPSGIHATWLLATGVFPLGILLLSSGRTSKRRMRVASGVLLSCLIAMTLAAGTSCGGVTRTAAAGSSLTSVTGTVTVQALSGSIPNTIAVKVTVQ